MRTNCTFIKQKRICVPAACLPFVPGKLYFQLAVSTSEKQLCITQDWPWDPFLRQGDTLSLIRGQ